mgnify:FL=1
MQQRLLIASQATYLKAQAFTSQAPNLQGFVLLSFLLVLSFCLVRHLDLSFCQAVSTFLTPTILSSTETSIDFNIQTGLELVNHHIEREG